MNALGEPDEMACKARVCFIAGSLKGMEGTVIRRRANDRLLVRLETSQRSVCVEIDASSVKRLERPLGT